MGANVDLFFEMEFIACVWLGYKARVFGENNLLGMERIKSLALEKFCMERTRINFICGVFYS